MAERTSQFTTVDSPRARIVKRISGEKISSRIGSSVIAAQGIV